MVTVGTGRDDPRGWVRAAYVVLDVIEQAGPRDKLPALAQIAAVCGVSRPTVGKACQELARRGLVYRIPGHGYYPRPGHDHRA
ncbi:MAG: GntR family transcriptional regulator [Streptosporangiaceae bacterium]